MPARAEAKAKGEQFYSTSKPCHRGHLSARRTINGICIECEEINRTAYRASNIEAARESCRRYKARNRARCIAVGKIWKAKNADRVRRSINASVKRWAKRNRTKINAFATKRRAAKLQRTPRWVDHAQIQAVYAACPKGFHVDHIVPLQGKRVSGLHVPWNLQIITALENVRKGVSCPL